MPKMTGVNFTKMTCVIFGLSPASSPARGCAMFKTMSKTPAVVSLAALPPSWPAFVDQVALGATPHAAAAALGYASPALTSARLMRLPQIRKALVQAVQGRLEGEAGPLAIQAVLDVLSDPEAPGAVKAKLALGVLDRIKPAPEDRERADKPLAQLTLAELTSEVERLRQSGQPGAQMRDVTPQA
jgi:hypothetical protein